VSRIVTGKFRLEVEPVDLGAVLDAALDSVRPMADAREVVVQPRRADGPCRLPGDAARLQQVCWNLLTNAIKFTPRGGHIEARVEQDEAAVTLSVRDDGEGIAA